MFNLFKKKSEATVPTETTTTTTVNVLNLNKGDLLNLSKTDSSLKDIRVSAGWDVNDRWGSDFDLDLCAILSSNGHAKKVVYYGDKKANGVHLDHDNLTGEGSGDDENMFVNFSEISPNIDEISVCVVIYNGASRNQHFSQVKNAYVRLVDQAVSPEKEICRYNLSHDGGKATAVEFAKLIKENNEWSFKAVGEYMDASITDIYNSKR